MKFHLPPPGRRLRRILTLLGQAALCCVLTAARLGGLYAPFSLAAAAAAGPGLPGLLFVGPNVLAAQKDLAGGGL